MMSRTPARAFKWRRPPTEAAYLYVTNVVSVISQTGHSNVSRSRFGSPEGSIRVIHVFAPQREQSGRAMSSRVVGTV
jgi:hypothetical protein